MEAFIKEQRCIHKTLIDKLADIAKTNPQNAYACYTKGLQSRLTFLSRTTPNMKDALVETEKAVRHNLLPKMLRVDSFDDDTRTLLSLPLKLAGLDIGQPEDQVASYNWSQKVSTCLETPETAADEQRKQTQLSKKEKQHHIENKRHALLNRFPEEKKYAVLLASEKGASNWLNVVPLKNIISTSHSQSLETAYILDMVGTRPTYLKNALVDLSSISRTHFTVLKVDSPTKDMMRLETHSLSLWMKFATMLRSNLTCSRCKTKALTTEPRPLKTRPDWISRQMDSGDRDFQEPFLT